jgi:hypothetical protein
MDKERSGERMKLGNGLDAEEASDHLKQRRQPWLRGVFPIL